MLGKMQRSCAGQFIPAATPTPSCPFCPYFWGDAGSSDTPERSWAVGACQGAAWLQTAGSEPCCSPPGARPAPRTGVRLQEPCRTGRVTWRHPAPSLLCCHPPVDAAQDTVDLPGCRWTLLALIQLFVHQDSEFTSAELLSMSSSPILYISCFPLAPEVISGFG